MTAILSQHLPNLQAALHANGDRMGFRPGHVVWTDSRWNRVDEPMWFCDGSIKQAPQYTASRKVGWLTEPPDLHPEDHSLAYQMLASGELQTVVTAFPRLMAGKDVRIYPHGGTRIHSSDWIRHHKETDPLVSIVASPKQSLPGHILRHQVIKQTDAIAFGQDYRRLRRKVDALAPFMFSIAIENVRSEYWFTEALLDCFLTNTVPIYWGCEYLIHWGFDPRGIIQCKDASDLAAQSTHVTKADYYHRLPYITHNRMAALAYTCTEDWMKREWPDLFADDVE